MQQSNIANASMTVNREGRALRGKFTAIRGDFTLRFDLAQ